jgi:hypothetical protein
MILDDETQENLRLALQSHQFCVHHGAAMCHMLILAELAIRRGYPVTSDEELEACGHFIADEVLQSLILKGFVSMDGVDENGQIMMGLTEAGRNRYELGNEE